MGLHLTSTMKYNRCLLLDHGLPLSSSFRHRIGLGTLGINTTSISTCGKVLGAFWLNSLYTYSHISTRRNLYFMYFYIL